MPTPGRIAARASITLTNSSAAQLSTVDLLLQLQHAASQLHDAGTLLDMQCAQMRERAFTSCGTAAQHCGSMLDRVDSLRGFYARDAMARVARSNKVFHDADEAIDSALKLIRATAAVTETSLSHASSVTLLFSMARLDELLRSTASVPILPQIYVITSPIAAVNVPAISVLCTIAIDESFSSITGYGMRFFAAGTTDAARRINRIELTARTPSDDDVLDLRHDDISVVAVTPSGESIDTDTRTERGASDGMFIVTYTLNHHPRANSVQLQLYVYGRPFKSAWSVPITYSGGSTLIATLMIPPRRKIGFTVSPDEQTILVGYSTECLISKLRRATWDDDVAFEADALNRMLETKGYHHRNNYNRICFTPYDSVIVTFHYRARSGREYKLTDLENPIKYFPTGKNPWGIAMHGDNVLIACSYESVQVHSYSSGFLVRCIVYASSQPAIDVTTLSCVAFLPNGKHFLVTHSGAARLFSVLGDFLRVVTPAVRLGTRMSVAISPSSEVVFANANTGRLHVIDVNDDTELASWPMVTPPSAHGGMDTIVVGGRLYLMDLQGDRILVFE